MPYTLTTNDARASARRAAARLFNRGLRGPIGEIMTAAGLRMAASRHFGRKAELYAEAVQHFLRKEAPARWQKRGGRERRPDQPFARFVVDAYLSRDHLDDVEGSCPLIGLSSDVARSSASVKAAYREVALSMIAVFRANLKGRAARDHAMVLLALCVGGMVLARALDDRDLAADFLATAHQHALATTGWAAMAG